MTRRAYFVVEGPQDVELLAKMLRPSGLRRVQQYDDLDPVWRRIVPRAFPVDGDLLRRVPVPAFFAGEGLSVAVHAAGGIGRVAEVARKTWANLDEEPEGFGVVVDADDEDVRSRWSIVSADLPVDDLGSGPGQVGDGPPRAGIFVLPDNAAAGTLESVLLDCAGLAYPSLLAGARGWIDGLDPADPTVFLNREERRDFAKPFGRDKAIVASIASVLRPGKAVQVSLQDNRWLTAPDALALPSLVALKGFVDAVLG